MSAESRCVMSAIKVKNPHVAGRIRTSHIKSVLIAVCDIYIYTCILHKYDLRSCNVDPFEVSPSSKKVANCLSYEAVAVPWHKRPHDGLGRHHSVFHHRDEEDDRG